jgi:hypothetical protein
VYGVLGAGIVAVPAVETFRVLPFFLLMRRSIPLAYPVTGPALRAILAHRTFQQGEPGKDTEECAERAEVFAPEPFFNEIQTFCT